MKRWAPWLWLALGLYFVVAAIGKGAGVAAAMALLCGFMASRAHRR